MPDTVIDNPVLNTPYAEPQTLLCPRDPSLDPPMDWAEEEEWSQLHRAELEANWLRMKAGQALDRIEPLN